MAWRQGCGPPAREGEGRGRGRCDWEESRPGKGARGVPWAGGLGARPQIVRGLAGPEPDIRRRTSRPLGGPPERTGARQGTGTPADAAIGRDAGPGWRAYHGCDQPEDRTGRLFAPLPPEIRDSVAARGPPGLAAVRGLDITSPRGQPTTDRVAVTRSPLVSPGEGNEEIK
ncbi:hypothetical protein NDU88_004971 [Pleurodeles waltl]|uniref:Uncharacterized protein n=1 Tax=Pleurodeles waltl TaxID=8319 RepID=A0AAV7NV95_PLEWA|nr:hypothetical protein NDU88_004971 [Pleurodeles waltl]